MRFYLRQVNEAWSIPDPNVVYGLSLASCKTCANLSKTAVTLKYSGRRYEGSAISLGLAAQLPESNPNTIYIQGPLVQEARKILNVRTGALEAVERLVQVGVLSVSWSSGGWKMREIQIESIS